MEQVWPLCTVHTQHSYNYNHTVVWMDRAALLLCTVVWMDRAAFLLCTMRVVGARRMVGAVHVVDMVGARHVVDTAGA